MINEDTFNVKFTELPDVLPVFPLDGVILLPQGQLPLNIFEPRYLAMMDDAFRSDRLIGIIQPQPDTGLRIGARPLQKIGCVGKIIEFMEHADGRYTIILHGLWRFSVTQELEQKNGYRRIYPNWQDFAGDSLPQDSLGINREKFRDLMMTYLEKHELFLDCDKLDKTSDAQLITALSMICPFDPLDKQALLEAPCCKTRADMFMVMLEIAAHDGENNVIH